MMSVKLEEPDQYQATRPMKMSRSPMTLPVRGTDTGDWIQSRWIWEPIDQAGASIRSRTRFNFGIKAPPCPKVLPLPNLIRSLPLATFSPRPIPVNPWEGSPPPEVQAEPWETQPYWISRFTGSIQ